LNDSGTRLRGTVKWFDNARGYGFVLSPEYNPEPPVKPDIFIHHSNIKADGYRTLEEGEDVEFTLSDGPKGIHAMDLVKLGVPSLV